MQHLLTSAQVIEDTEQQLGSLPSQALPQWLGAYAQSPAKPPRPVAALRPDTAVTTSQEAALADSPALVRWQPTVQEPAPAQPAGKAIRPEAPGSLAAPTQPLTGGSGLSRRLQQNTAQQELAHRQALAELMTQQDLDESSEAAEGEPQLRDAGGQGAGQHAATDLDGAAGAADEGVQPGSAASPSSGRQEGQQQAALAEVAQAGPGTGREQVTPPSAAGAGTSSTPAAVVASSPAPPSLGAVTKTVSFSDKRKSGTK